MDTLLFAECQRLFQSLSDSIGPEDDLGAIGLLLLEPRDGLVDRIADLRELVCDQTAVEIHRDDLRPGLFVFRSLNCFYIHLIHVCFSFSKYQSVIVSSLSETVASVPSGRLTTALFAKSPTPSCKISTSSRRNRSHSAQLSGVIQSMSMQGEQLTGLL